MINIRICGFLRMGVKKYKRSDSVFGRLANENGIIKKCEKVLLKYFVQYFLKSYHKKCGFCSIK